VRILVIMNPAAGRSRDRGPEQIVRRMRDRGLPGELELTRHPGHAALLARAAAGYEAILAVGGDGTLHDVLQGLDLERHRLAVLPWGTGNDFAWLHGWSDDPDACLDRVAAGGERRVDLGEFDAVFIAGRPRTGRFHNNVGFGFEAAVNQRSHSLRRIRGPLVYLAALFATLPRYRNWNVRVAWEGGGYQGESPLLTVANGKRTGGLFLLAPQATTDDGHLDLVFSTRAGRMRLLTLLPRSFTGSHLRSPLIRAARSPFFRVEVPDGIPVHVDGEFLDPGVTRLDLRALPGGLRTF
jgi:diacylglycerol kinase (ATP)